MAEVHGEAHLARYDVRRVRLDLERADGADRERRMPARDRVHRLDEPRRADERVLAQMHRRSARVGILADEARLVPAHALHAGHDADVLRFRLEDRPLLDMQLEECRERMRPARLRTAIADRFEGLAERHAGAILARGRPGAVERSREDAGRRHRGREPRALLIGPVHDLDRSERLVAGLDQGPQRLERAEHAQYAVEFAACRLGVEVAPHRDRRHVLLSRPAREHRPHVVDRHPAAEAFGARLEPVAHLAVEVGQGQPADAAFRGRADRGGFHQLAPQALCVDVQIFHDRTLARTSHPPRRAPNQMPSCALCQPEPEQHDY